jgi:hypothetical protein
MSNAARTSPAGVVPVLGVSDESLVELRAVLAHLGEPAAVAVLLLLGRYAAHAVVGRVLRLGPPVSEDPPPGTTPNPPHRRTT